MEGVTPVTDLFVLREHGHRPIHEYIVRSDEFAGGRIGDVERFERIVHAGQVVFGVGSQGFGGVLAETVEEVGEIEETESVMRREIGGVGIRPVVQLQVGILGIHPVRAAHIITVEKRAEFRETLVDPRNIVAIRRELDHVYEFVGQRGIGVVVGQVLRRAKHVRLVAVGIFMHQRVVGIRRGEIARHRCPDVAGVDHVNVRVAVYAGRPLTAEELAVGGIDLVLKGVHQGFEIVHVHVRAVLRPEIGMRRDVLQGGVNLEMLVRIGIRDPEFLLRAGFQRRGGRGQGLRHVADALQAAGQFVRIILRDNGIFERLKRTRGYILHRRARHHNLGSRCAWLKRECEIGHRGFNRLCDAVIRHHAQRGNDQKAGAAQSRDHPDDDQGGVGFTLCGNWLIGREFHSSSIIIKIPHDTALA